MNIFMSFYPELEQEATSSQIKKQLNRELPTNYSLYPKTQNKDIIKSAILIFPWK